MCVCVCMCVMCVCKSNRNTIKMRSIVIGAAKRSTFQYSDYMIPKIIKHNIFWSSTEGTAVLTCSFFKFL